MEQGNQRPLTGSKIGIFGRGGAGKSTVAVLLARALRSAGYDVVVLDADSTNVGLSAALGATHRPRPLIDHFGGMVFNGGSVTCPVDDPTPLAGAILPAGAIPAEIVVRTRDGIRFFEAGKVAERGTGAGCDGPIAKIARDFRVRHDGESPVMVTDFKAGFEDAARGVITGLNWIVVVVDPSLAAVEMALDVKRAVEQIRAGGLPATHHLESPSLVEMAHGLYRNASIRGVAYVLNKVPDARTERILRRKLSKGSIDPSGVIPADAAVASAWLDGEPMPAGRPARVVEGVVCQLEAAEASSTDSILRYRHELDRRGADDDTGDARTTHESDGERARSGGFFLHD